MSERFGVKDLVVRYGPTTAVEGLSFEVSGGEILALVGADGAGKTSALKAFAGALAPGDGSVTRPPDREIGYVSGDSGVYRDLTTEENLFFSGSAYGLKGQKLESSIAGLLDTAGLTDARTRLAGDLSGGMRQKLALSMALLHEPRLLILDEPTTGVDPVSRGELWRTIARAAAQGAAIVFSTTYIDEAERAGYVIALESGRVLAEGSPQELIGSIPGRIIEARERPEDGRFYRRGAAFRIWLPESRKRKGIVVPDLQDALTVAALGAEAGEAG